MARIFAASSAEGVWQMAARAFRDGHAVRTQDSRVGPTMEIPQAMFVISEPCQRWVVSRKPPVNPAFAIAEIVWILQGRNDARFVNYWNRQLARFAGDEEFYHGAYGYRLRRHFGVDQLAQAYHILSRNPEGRQVVLQLWDARVDLPGSDGSPVAPDIPCNVCSLLKIRDGALHWTQVLRSNDLFLGVPYNVVQFTTVQEVLAGWLGVTVGPYTHLSDSLHVYARDQDSLAVSRPVQSVPRNPDVLGLPYDESAWVIGDLAAQLENFTGEHLTEPDLVRSVTSFSGPPAYRNLLAVAAAEAARRHHWPEAMTECIQGCSNRLLRKLWNNWMGRFNVQRAGEER